jgi:hypothetical protein
MKTVLLSAENCSHSAADAEPPTALAPPTTAASGGILIAEASDHGSRADGRHGGSSHISDGRGSKEPDESNTDSSGGIDDDAETAASTKTESSGDASSDTSSDKGFLGAGEVNARADVDSTECRRAAEIVDETVDGYDQCSQRHRRKQWRQQRRKWWLKSRFLLGRMGCVTQVSSDVNISSEQARNEDGDGHFSPVNVSHTVL